MSNHLQQKLKALPEINFPENLHGKIMRRAYIHQFRTPLISIMFLLLINLALSGWRLGVRAMELDTISSMRATLEGFELSLDFVQNFFQNFVLSVPIANTLIFIVNLSLLSYVSFLFFKLQKIQSLAKVE